MYQWISISWFSTTFWESLTDSLLRNHGHYEDYKVYRHTAQCINGWLNVLNVKQPVLLWENKFQYGEWGGVSGSLEGSGVLTNFFENDSFHGTLTGWNTVAEFEYSVTHYTSPCQRQKQLVFVTLISIHTYISKHYSKTTDPLWFHKVLFKSALGLSFSLWAILMSSFSEVSPLHLIYWNADTCKVEWWMKWG